MPFNVVTHGSLGYHDYLTRKRAQQELEQQQMLANLQADQLRAQTAAMRQQSQLQWAQANPQSFPQYAGGGRGGNGVDESMLPEITAPKYLSANAEEPGSNVNWDNVTPDSLRGSGTIAMSIARPGESPDAADAYYRTLTPNPQYDTQQRARAQAQYDLTRGGGSGLDIARINADTRLRGYENAMALAGVNNQTRRETAAANLGAKLGGDIVNRTTMPQAQGLVEESMDWASKQLPSGGGVGGGQSAAPEDVQVEVLGEMNGWKKIRRGGKLYAVKDGQPPIPVDE